MGKSLSQTALWATAAGLVGAGAFLACHRFVPGADPIVVGALVAATAVCTAWLERRRQRKHIKALAAVLDTLREQPLTLGVPSPAGDELQPVAHALNRLALAYRQALNGLVRSRHELDGVRGTGEAARLGKHSSAHRDFVAGLRRQMVVRLTPNFHVSAATPALQEFLDLPPTDLLGRSFLDFVRREDVAALSAVLRDALGDGEAHNVAFRLSLPLDAAQAESRREHHLQMDAMTAFTETGEPLHVRCHFVDVSDRVRAERELRRRTAELSAANAMLQSINADLQRLKESYSDLYHQAPVCYFSVDASGNLVACNETFVETLGYPREALIGRPYGQLLAPGNRATYEADPDVLQRHGETETRWVKQDGAVIDVWIGTSTIEDAHDAFVRSRSAARDISERNQLAHALRSKAEEIEQTNERLRRINRELEEFTHAVSHDLKEPLRTLEAFSTFLAHDYADALGGEGREYIDHLIQASRRLRALIDDLLALCTAGRVIHDPRDFAWDEVIRTTLGDLHDLIQRSQATVRVEGLLPPTSGDSERVIELLTNLIGNGLKYNRSTSPEVVVGSRAQLVDDGFVTLYVRDNGIGIEPRYQAQVFRMFRRLHARADVDGTGAGLAICRKIVEAHGGRLWVESSGGHGSTFLFTLPRGQFVPSPAGSAPSLTDVSSDAVARPMPLLQPSESGS